MLKRNFVIAFLLFIYGSYAQPSTNYGGEIHYQSFSTQNFLPSYSKRVINDSITVSYNHPLYPYTYRFSLKSGKWVSLGPDSIKYKRGFDQFAEVAGNNLVGFDGSKLYTYDNQMVNVLDSMVPVFEEVYGCNSGFFGFGSLSKNNMRYSTDGLTWLSSTFPSGFNGTNLVLKDVKEDRIVIANGTSAIVYSTNGGRTFSTLTNRPSNFSIFEVKLVGNNGLYILSDNSYYSPNMGVSWQNSARLTNYSKIVPLRGDSILAIRSSFDTINKLSVDGGLTWNNWYSTFESSPEENALVAGDTVYLIDVYHRVKKLNHSGSVEYFTFPPFGWSCSGNISGISVKGNKVLFNANRDCIGLSEDGGYHFKTYDTPYEFTWSDFLPNGDILGVGANGGVYHSSTGYSFLATSSASSIITPLSSDSTGSKIIYSSNNAPNYSNDGGRTFQVSSIHNRFYTTYTPGGQILGCFLWSGPFIGNKDKLVINKFRTDGATFPIDTFDFSGTDLSWETMVMLGENMGWIFLLDKISNEIMVLFSKDGWQSLSVISTIPYTPYWDDQINWLEIYSPNEIYLSIGENQDPYYSTDTGKTFYPITSLPTLRIGGNNIATTAINFGDTNSWFLAKNDMLIMNNIQAWPQKKAVDLSLKYKTGLSNGEVYPNPAHSRVFFPKGAMGVVKIYTLNGLACDELEIINSSIQLNALKQGMYFLHYKVYDEVRVSKLMVK
jgi:hypothetical protein